MQTGTGCCQCGCGDKVVRSNKYIHGHHTKGTGNPKYKGGVIVVKNRTYLRLPWHPQTTMGGYVPLHRVVAETALGKVLPQKAVVHHVDMDVSNNRNSNLVVCEEENYHKLLHKRQRAYAACGHALWLKCKFCKQYDDPSNLHLIKERNNGAGYHSDCSKEYDKKRSGNHGPIS